MPAAYPSAYNTFIRDHDASNKMVVDFARAVNKFAVNRYTQIVPTKKVAGYFLRMTVEEAGRIIHSDLKNFVWHDGQEAPTGVEGIEGFEFFPFECKRYAFPFQLGNLTVDQASWNILAQHASIKARQAMTARTQLAITELTNSATIAAMSPCDTSPSVIR